LRDYRGELERARRELHASLALIRPGSAVRVPILARLRAVEAELADRASQTRADRVVNLTPGQVDRIDELSDQSSFLWDKRRAVWIAAEDCPDGEQVEDTDLDAGRTGSPATSPRPCWRRDGC
jgi:hypothetical protein